MWVNGALVHTNAQHRAAAPEQDRVKVKLKKGTNTILFKINNGDGGHGFYFTIVSEQELIASRLQLTMGLVNFSDFMKSEIFPGGFLPTIQMVKEHALKAGFKLARRQSLQRHYAKTLDI